MLGLVLPGCGPADTPSGTATTGKVAAKAAPPRDTGTSAEEVARQARGDLKCPANAATPARAPNAPADDVQGVRPGMGFDQAMNAVLCTQALLVAAVDHGRGFELKAPGAREIRQGFAARYAEPRVVKTSKQILLEMQQETIARGGNAVRVDLEPGRVKWFVGAMGLPGRERVLSVARAERFATEQRPTIDTVLEALVTKYGEPTQLQRGNGNAASTLRWSYDPQGQRIGRQSPLVFKCSGPSSPDAGVTLSPDCGLVVAATLVPPQDNAGLVDRLEVGVVDQAGGYALLGATEQALREGDRQRQAQELEKASRSAKAPTL